MRDKNQESRDKIILILGSTPLPPTNENPQPD